MSKLTRIENVFSHPLEQRGFAVYRGWNDDIADQLVVRSREDEMLEHVRHDAQKRFTDQIAAHEWYEENERTVYALGEKALLAGVVWFSHHPRPELGADYTFAIRMYEAARGKGLAGAFMMAAHKDFEAHEKYEGGIWLEADDGNTRAQRLYERFGYNAVAAAEDRVTMVRRGLGSDRSVPGEPSL